RVVTPNRAEAQAMVGTAVSRLQEAAAAAQSIVDRWMAAGVAVTLGARGAVLVSSDGTPLAVPAAPVDGGDACGAGDKFATTVAACLADGALLTEAVVTAVRA